MSLYAVVDPATGEVVREYPTATDAQIEDALAAAARAFGMALTGASTIAAFGAAIVLMGLGR